MRWREFELFTADLFRRLGFRVEDVGGQSDGGIDLILHSQGGVVHLVQCKKYNDWNVGVRAIREFFGVVTARGASGVGLFVTCGTFTPDAREFAGRTFIHLVDGNELLKLIAMANGNGSAPQPAAGSPASAQRPFSGEAITPVCPRCKAPMVRRIAKQGPRQGDPLWGCSQFPRCRYVLDIKAD